MEEEREGQVTISLRHYEEMKNELETLREKVKEKTIIKEIPNKKVATLITVAVYSILIIWAFYVYK